MSESKHTPGPWHTMKKNEHCIRVYATNDDLEFICEVWRDGILCHSVQDLEANAELIASAPSLLSELEQLRKENEKLKSDLKIMQELDAEHDKEWDASILKDAKITDLCNVNEKYRQALEKIHGMTNHFSPVNHIAGNALDNIVK